jgi:signal transduction histidine kinase
MLHIESFEELNETLLELKRSKEREARLAEENQVILASLSSLSSAENKQQIFDELKKVLGRYIDFDDFIVISKGKFDSTFKTFLSSNSQLNEKTWPQGSKFKRVLSGECILLFDPFSFEEFQSVPQALQNKIKTALITGIQSQASDSVLLLLGNRKGQFSVETKTTLLRFRPLLERAISDIEHKEKLQSLVDLKTQELVQAQLVVEKANDAKSKFLAMMSHELRTPLNAVLGIIELLRSESNAYQRDLLERMENSAELLHVIIGDILDFSRIESGHFTLHRHWTNLHSKIASSFDYHRKIAEEKGLYFNVTTSICQEFEYFVDPVRILQIIFNIVGNAIKFTQKGGVTIVINTSHDHLNIKVSDTGIGIEKSKISQLFSPFIQADNSITRNYGGTGLGLTITKYLVDLMNGSIEVDTKVEKGTCFSVLLPLVVKKSLRAQSVVPSYSVEEKPLAAVSKRILVVEDTSTNQMILKLMLQRLGYSVTIVNNGLEALKEIEENRDFDIVFMDISMPIMDGIEATKALRSRNYSKPIIALTAHSLLDNRQKCLDVGMNDVLLKPINSKQLHYVIDKYTS